MSDGAKPLRVVFMGTPAFSADILEELAAHENVVGVYTQPDRVRSRGNKTQASPVKERAQALGLPVTCLSSFKDEASLDQLKALAPDVICVAAFGVILPKTVLTIPDLGCLNVHTSILPRWRGAAPIERALLAGDEEVGVCIMRMEEGLDTGDFCICRRIPVGEMDATDVTHELSVLGSVALLAALEQLREGVMRWTPQDDQAVTYADKIGKRELYLDPAESALVNIRRVRASSAAHPAKASIEGRSLTVLKVRRVPEELAEGLEAGEARLVDGALMLGCAAGALEAVEVKPDGKRAMSGRDLAQGMPALKTGGRWAAL